MKFCPSCGARYEDAAKFCQHDGTLLRKTSAGTDDDPYVGQILLGQFEIKEVIGEGGMGRVYRAHQHGFDRPVAIKILHTDLITNPEMVKRFNREAKIISRLDHPGIIHVYLFGELPDGNLYLAMEYVDGQSLTKLINEGPMPVHEAIHIGRQMLSALTEAHRKGVVHRDLKPDNIMLVSRPDDPISVKVLDFGIAKFLGSRTMLTQQGLVFGSARYISPEAAAGDPVDERADLYAVGVILYQMLAGKPPFDDASAVSLLMRHVNDKPPPLLSQPAARHLHEGLAKVVMQALEKDPSHRFDEASEMRKALVEAARGGGVQLRGEEEASWVSPDVGDKAEPRKEKETFKTDPMFGGAMSPEVAAGEGREQAPDAATEASSSSGVMTDPQIPSVIEGDPAPTSVEAASQGPVEAQPYYDPNDDDIELPRSRAWIVLLVIAILVVSGGAMGALLALGSRDDGPAEETPNAGTPQPPPPVTAVTQPARTTSPPTEPPTQADADLPQAPPTADIVADLSPTKTTPSKTPRTTGPRSSGAPGSMPPAASLSIRPRRSRVGHKVRFVASISPASSLTSSRFVIKRRGGESVTAAAKATADGSYGVSHVFKRAGTYQVSFVGTSKAGEVRAFSDTVVSPARPAKQPVKVTNPPGLRDLPDAIAPRDPTDKPPDHEDTQLVEPWLSPSQSPW